MDRAELTEGIRKIISSIVKHDRFEMKDELTAADVDGWDSISHMAIMSEIEDKFNIKFRLKELKKITNLGSLLEIVNAKIDEPK